MTSVFAIVVCFLGLVLVWSGLAKLRQPAAAAQAMIDFGIARTERQSLAIGLSVAEILLGVTLVTGRVATLALAVATLLFTSLALLIHGALNAGRSFPCNCFGDSQAQISWWTLLRAVGLGVLAVSALLVSLRTVRDDTPNDVVIEVCAAGAVLGLALLGRALPTLLKPAVRSRGQEDLW